jgi:hypothetical protein
VAAWTHASLVRVLERHGRLRDAADTLAADQPVLAQCYGASASDVQLLGDEPGRRTQKAFGPVRVKAPRAAAVAEVGGINVHASAAVDGRDRRRLEQLCRYMARPPLCQERLEQPSDGRIRLSLKKAWKDGTHAILLAPLDFIARLCAIIPPPRFHMLHYHGVLAGGSVVRQAIVPGRADPPKPKNPIPLFGQDEDASPATPLPSRHPWPWLLARVFAVDILKCPVRSCSGEMKVVEIAKTTEHAARILAGFGARPPTRRSRIPARQLALPFAP